VWHDEKETDIRKERDNKDIDKKNPFVEREGSKCGPEDPKTFLHLVHGGPEDIF
jgi:hypothetical protein